MIFGSFVKSFITREAISRAIPVAKKIFSGAGKIAMREAGRTVGGKTVDAISNAPKKVEDFVEKKKSEFFEEAEGKAEQFFVKQMEILDERIDKKIVDVEMKFDEKIKSVFWVFLISMFLVTILTALTFSILFKYFDF